MKKVIRIGTRDSTLALWQANVVKDKLEKLGHTTQLVAVKAAGDILLDKPLYELGITGIFTKALDIAMLNGTVDIVVHSMKDVPTALPKGIVQTAVLRRATASDILVTKSDITTQNKCTIATGSLRRKAQWLNKFPHHVVVDLRGNVNTRLKKLEENSWDGAIFAKAGLERIDVLPKKFLSLDWMVPAPAQGAMVVVTLDEDVFCKKVVSQLNDDQSYICTYIERQFLRTLEGGCTAPIGAFAYIYNNEIYFTASLHALDGSNKIEIERVDSLDAYKDLGKKYAEEVLKNGGDLLLKSIKEQLR